jgi:hypothetical protein
MNSLIKFRHIQKSSVLFTAFQRNITNTPALFGGFAKDYKPGPYPKTEEERLAAAKKYGLK